MNNVTTPTSQMKLFYDSSQVLLERCYPSYSQSSKSVISNISRDTSLSQFDSFNKRLKISWGMQIVYTDGLRITAEDTRACYILMLKIADLWFAFEHLVEIASKIIPKDAMTSNTSKVDLYQDGTLEALGFHHITSNFNQLLRDHVLHTPAYRQETYMLLAYLKNCTERGTQKAIVEATSRIKAKQDLQAKHILALAYGVRNIYVHKGVAAALGSRSYKAKRALYSALHDSLILYSLALGDNYCQKQLSNSAYC